MSYQCCHGGVRLVERGPSLPNVQRLDAGAIPMLSAMMAGGLQIDPGHFLQMAKMLEQDMEELTEKVSKLAGHYLNLDSGDQVSNFLFKELGLKQARPKLTRSGDRESVENEVLVAIQHDHEVVTDLLQFKELSKLKGTYADKIPKKAKRVGPGEWRLFPNLTHTRVPTGRFAAKEPNMLALPNRTKRGRELKKGFITRPGWVYVSVDFSQIEPRVAAHESQDENLINVYLTRQDVYSDFATSAFSLEDKRFEDENGWHYPTVDKIEHRFPSKTCILASLYRVTAVGLQEQMPIICGSCHLPTVSQIEGQAVHDCGKFRTLWTEEKCQDIINAFYLRYPGLAQMQRIHDARCRKFLYTWDGWGRLMHTTAVKSVHPWIVATALREAGNMPIQGFAAGCLKLAMAEVQEMIEGGMEEVVHPLLPIHDELLFEVREDIAEEWGQYVVGVFEQVVKLTVPIKAEMSIAENWGSVAK